MDFVRDVWSVEVAGKVMRFIGKGGLRVLGLVVAGAGRGGWLGAAAFKGPIQLGIWGC